MKDLEKISKIKNIGNFANFDAETDSDLKRNTVVYAGNGGGKTNLSKLLNYLSNPDLDLEDLKSREAKTANQEIEFKVRIGGRNITADNYKNPEMQELTGRLQVFNDEFVKTNVACDNFSNKDLGGDVIVADVGEEGIKLKAAKQQLATARAQAASERSNIESKLQEFVDAVEQDGVYTRNDDRNVWKELAANKIVKENGRPNKEGLDTIEALSGEDGFSTCEEDLAEIKGLSDTDKLTIGQTLEDGDMDLDEIKTILETEHSVDDIDEDIKGNFERVRVWLSSESLNEQAAQSILQKAITASHEDGACTLCRKDLDDSSKKVLNWYQIYLDGERAKFEKRIDNQTKKLKLLKDKVEDLNNDLEAGTNRYAKLFGIKKSWTKIDNAATVDALNGLITSLNDKGANPGKAYVYDADIPELLTKLQSTVRANSGLCEQINKRMNENASLAASLRTLIGKKLLQEFVSANSKELSDLENAHSQIDNATAEIDSLTELMGETSVIEEVKRLFNKFLHDSIGLKKYSAETEDGRIYIKLLKSFDISQETQRISEGEKQMIGLCYFLASRIKGLNSAELFRRGIFVIDDPVSSISYSNFFGVTSLIQNFETAFKEAFKEEDKSFKVQKIILTHNIQLFNILQKHVMHRSEKCSWVFYRLQDDGLKRLSSKRLLSDFEMSLYRIMEAAKDDKSTILNFNVANDMRRVLETIKHFFGYEDLDPETMRKIFPYISNISGDCTDLYQLINCCSHSTLETALDPLQEALDSGVKQFIELIKHEESPFRELCLQMESV